MHSEGDKYLYKSSINKRLTILIAFKKNRTGKKKREHIKVLNHMIETPLIVCYIHLK